jgi:hypothetical protein
MALGTNQVTTSVANNFIPELWSDEVQVKSSGC